MDNDLIEDLRITLSFTKANEVELRDIFEKDINGKLTRVYRFYRQGDSFGETDNFYYFIEDDIFVMDRYIEEAKSYFLGKVNPGAKLRFELAAKEEVVEESVEIEDYVAFKYAHDTGWFFSDGYNDYYAKTLDEAKEGIGIKISEYILKD